LTDFTEIQDLLTGFIAIHPAGTEDYPKSFFREIRIPTIFLIGEKYAKMVRKSAEKLKLIPKSQRVLIEKAGHAPYLDNPTDWEKVLYNFLWNLKSENGPETT